jgi:hypothetical protein
MATYRAYQVTAPGQLAMVERELLAPQPGHVRRAEELALTGPARASR